MSNSCPIFSNVKALTTDLCVFSNPHDYTPLRQRCYNIDTNLRNKKDFQAKDALLRKLRKQNVLLKKQNDALKSGDLPLVVLKRAVADALKDKFSPAQIYQILKPRNKSGKTSNVNRCQKWSENDYKKAKRLKSKVSAEAYEMIKNEFHVPLPGLSTLSRKDEEKYRNKLKNSKSTDSENSENEENETIEFEADTGMIIKEPVKTFYGRLESIEFLCLF